VRTVVVSFHAVVADDGDTCFCACYCYGYIYCMYLWFFILSVQSAMRDLQGVALTVLEW